MKEVLPMKLHKTLIAGMIAIACTTLVTAPTVFAKGNANAGSNRVVSYQGLGVAEGEALLFMREEEKLARDVYITLYQQWKLPAFNNISASEQQHTDRIKQLIQTYGLVDPVVNDAVGAFANGQLASLYAQLLAKGRISALDALQAGALIEETDIADLQKAIAGTTRPDIAAVYENLMKGSRNHLRAFVGLIENQGIAYTAQALPQAEVDAIVNSPRERGNANGGGRGQGGGAGMGRGWR
jgi:hypothetical protein